MAVLKRLACTAVLAVLGGGWASSRALAASAGSGDASAAVERLSIRYPYDGTLFPADIRSPRIRWEDAPNHKAWLLRFTFQDPKSDFHVFVDTDHWMPPPKVWEAIKKSSLETPAALEVSGIDSHGSPEGKAARIGFSTSKDAVEFPIFFRLVPTIFPADKDFVKMKWKLGRVSSYDPPITVMKNQTRCFNCHASSLDGKSYAFIGSREYNRPDRKGQYRIFRNPGRKVVLEGPEDLIEWKDYIVDKADRLRHQAFLTAISPDGGVYVTPGKVAMAVDFKRIRDTRGYTVMTRGILLYYAVKERVIRALPGADDERYVHIPGSWSPDGKFIYFTRATITPQFDELNRTGMDAQLKKEQAKLGWRDLDKIYPFKYDVYRIPFNDGKGGLATPVPGASGNGKSNYLPRISPDGKWLVFAQSASGMNIGRKDGDLYIVAAGGGKARKLRASGARAESWHTWSPNSRWLAFSSKSYGPHTDIVLTHIDANGVDSPPIVLTWMREWGLSANIPEFFNIKPGVFEEIDPSRFDDEYRARSDSRSAPGLGDQSH